MKIRESLKKVLFDLFLLNKKKQIKGVKELIFTNKNESSLCSSLCTTALVDSGPCVGDFCARDSGDGPCPGDSPCAQLMPCGADILCPNDTQPA